MPLYPTEITERGPEPLIRRRAQLQPADNSTKYKLTKSDIERVKGFPLETVALHFFGAEDLAWILTDVNDNIKEPNDWKIGDVIIIPHNWINIAKTSRPQTSTRRY